MTITHQFPVQQPINLHTLPRDHFRVELELFPAAQWINRTGGRENINVFHTGCVIITGVISTNKAEYLLTLVQNALPSGCSILD